MIRLEDVSRSYGEGDNVVHAVQEVTADIESGSYTAIIGASGSGKSTLLNLIGALDRPTRGKIEVAERDLGKMNDRERTLFRRTKIGFVFQFFNLLPTLSAYENVVLPAELAGRAGKDTRARGDELLDRVGLGKRRAHRPNQLSGGEMQRVAIARALMMDPPLIVADEPTGNLDSKTGQSILQLLRESVGNDRTMVLVTHDPKIAAQADAVITMKDGRILEEAS